MKVVYDIMLTSSRVSKHYPRLVSLNFYNHKTQEGTQWFECLLWGNTASRWSWLCWTSTWSPWVPWLVTRQFVTRTRCVAPHIHTHNHPPAAEGQMRGLKIQYSVGGGCGPLVWATGSRHQRGPELSLRTGTTLLSLAPTLQVCHTLAGWSHQRKMENNNDNYNPIDITIVKYLFAYNI